MKKHIYTPEKKRRPLNEYSHSLINEDDLELDIEGDETDGEQVDDELGLETDQNESNLNEVEIDVTDLIKKQDEMLSRFDEMIGAINGINANKETDQIKEKLKQIDSVIKNNHETLKKEIIKRMPTPNEKLKVQSMNSFPYNISLSDYWMPADKENEEEIVMSDTENPSEESYELSNQEIEKDYSEITVRNSLNT